MDKFAFIFHPYDIQILADAVVLEPSLKMKNQHLIENMLRWLPPIQKDTVLIRSATGTTVEGEMILLPLVSEQILHLDEKFIFKKVIDAGKLAQKLGAKIIGLGAYLAGVGRRGVLLSEALNIPVTTGTSYTIAIAIEAALKAACDVGINLKEAKVGIIGATGSIGKACSVILSNQVGSLMLIGRNQERLESIVEYIRLNFNQPNITCSTNIKQSVKNCDIVIIATTSPSELLSVNDLNPGCIVCDISVPHNISSEDAEQSSILVIDGGLVQCPGNVNFPYLALAPGLAYACLSEVMMLELEGMFQNYSIGGNISVIKILKISQLASKHGFCLSKFRSFGKVVSQNKINIVKEARFKRDIT